jgi:hypothetical protein
MAKTVKGGGVRRQAEQKKFAVAVEKIDFPNVAAQAPTPPPNSAGVMTLTKAPHDPYRANEQLSYEDSNNNNARTLQVTSVVGPSKYNINAV